MTRFCEVDTMPAWPFFRRSAPVLVGIAVVTVALSAHGAGQRPAGGGRVIVRVLTNAGEPVTDLKKEEITLRMDGKQREIRELEIVRVAAEAAAGPAVPSSALPSPFATSTAAPTVADNTREFLILLDEEGIAAGREEPVRLALGQLMSKMSPSDRVGLLSLRIGGVNIPPTPGHDSVKAALAKFVGGGTSRETATDMACRSKRALETIGGVFRGAPMGRTILVVSSGVAPPTSQKMLSLNEQSTDVCQIRTPDLEQLGTAAAGSPANLYVLYYPDGMAATANLSTGQQGIENIAGVVNGEFMRISGNVAASIARISHETSVYYIATLDDAASGPVRRVDARVNREGAKVHARPVGAPAGTPPAASAKRMSPRDMIRTTAVFSDVPLRAAGFVSRQGASDMKFVTLFEPIDPGGKITAASVALIGDKGSGVQWNAQPADLERSPLAASLMVAPGRYRVRVAATTASGAGGTVDYELIAALHDAAPLKMSTMLLGVSERGFVPKLQFRSTDAQAVGFLELYNVPKGANVTVEFELAENETAPPLGDAPGTVAPGNGDDARIAYGGFGITTLQPGDYVMRAKISIDGKHVGTATRTLRKVN